MIPFKDLPTSKQLDTIIGYLHTDLISNHLISDMVGRLKQNEIIATERDIRFVLNKLIKDQFVTRDKEYSNGIVQKTEFGDIPLNEQQDLYYLTFEGKVFLENGGYEKEAIRQNAENIRLDKIENDQKNFRYTQNVLLFLSALGVSIAAWYYVEYLNKDFYHWW